MPEKIWLRRGGHLEGKYIEAMPITDAKLYHRDEIVKALEAQNKMLAVAVLALGRAMNGNDIAVLSKLHAEAIALAQQIGEKNVEVFK